MTTKAQLGEDDVLGELIDIYADYLSGDFVADFKRAKRQLLAERGRFRQVREDYAKFVIQEGYYAIATAVRDMPDYVVPK